MNSRPRITGWSVALAVCVLLVVSTPPLAAAPLPRLVISLPQGAPAGDLARTMAAAGVSDGVIVLRSVAARISGPGPVVVAGLLIADPGELAPALAPYLYLTLTVGDVPGAGRDREVFIESRPWDSRSLWPA
jgi:hypothetical protein